LDAPWFIPLLAAHGVSPRLPSREFAWHRLPNLIGSCGRYGAIVSAKHYPGFGLACCDLRSKTHLPVNAFRNSGSRSGASLGVNAACCRRCSGQPRSRMADSLALDFYDLLIEAAYGDHALIDDPA
jgi:hypothetical protein